MRRLKLFVATSIDGYIAGKDGDVSWQLHDADYGYAPFFAGVDTVLVDRRAYETALASGRWPYPERKVVVLTCSGELNVSSPDTVATSRAPSEVVADLRLREGKDLWLAGGSDLMRACLDQHLIDDIVVSIHPVILGEGIPLVAGGSVVTKLALLAERRFPSGLVQLAYRAERD